MKGKRSVEKIDTVILIFTCKFRVPFLKDYCGFKVEDGLETIRIEWINLGLFIELRELLN
jgi:hypothetical protein